jgi:hypothetical protein
MPLEKEKPLFTAKKEITADKPEKLSESEKEQRAMKILEEIDKEAETTKIKDDAFYQKVAEKMKEIKRIFNPEPIPSLEAEKQYQSQIEIFTGLGILKKLESGQMGIIDINGKEQPIPTLEEINQRIEAKQEILEKKQEQGFTKLLIVPFGMKLDDLREIYKKQILKHHKEGKLLATKEKEADRDEPLGLDESQSLWTWEEYEKADINNNLVYYPEQLDKDNHKGKTKKELLNESVDNAWNIILIEDMPNIPAEGKGKTKAERKQFEANQTPREYLKTIQSDPQYQHEQGMTPEDQLIYSIIHLEQTNQVIDDYQGKGKISYQIGAFFPSSVDAPSASWLRGSRQAALGRVIADDRGDNIGFRPAVKV